MKLGLLVSSLFLLAAGSSSAQAATTCAPSIGSCDYYLCRDEAQTCGARGYLEGFGYHYCHSFETAVKAKVSPAGAAWLDRVATCLQASLDQLPLAASCNTTHGYAIRTHAACYVSTGWCQLSSSDQAKVVAVVFPASVDPRVDWEFLKIMNACADPRLTLRESRTSL